MDSLQAYPGESTRLARKFEASGTIFTVPSTTPISTPQSDRMAEGLVKTTKRNYAKLALRPNTKSVMQKLAHWFEH
jgi:putative transposase